MTPEIVAQLRKEGYSDGEIAEELRTQDSRADTLLREGYFPTEVVNEVIGIKPQAPKQEASEDPSIARIAAGIVAQTAIEESAKVAGTAAGTATGIAYTTAVTGGAAAPAAPVTGTIGAGLGYVSGAITGGVIGSITAQEIEGRETISWGRVAGDTLLNFIPGTELKSGPRLLRKISQGLARHPIAGTAIVGGVSSPAAIALERWSETGEAPSFDEMQRAGLTGMALGASLGWSGDKATQLMRRFAGKPAKVIDDLVTEGDRGAVAYINAFTENVDPREFMTRENVAQHIKNLGASVQSRVAPSKLVGDATTQAIRDAKNIASAGSEIGGFLGKRVNDAIRNSAKPQDTRQLAVDYLGGKIAVLPQELKGMQGDLSQARKYIKEYQEQLLFNHYRGQRPLTDAFRVQIEDSMNRGDYLTRSYRFFEDAEFRPTRKQLESLRTRLGSDGMSPREVDQYIAELNAKRASNPEELHDWVMSQNAGILKEKKDLAPELRTYLGEYTTPGEQLAGTMSRLSRLVAYDAADATASKALFDAGLIKQAGTELPEGWLPIKLRRGNAHIGQEELYGPPDLQVAINQLYGMNADGKSMDIADSLIGDLWDTGVSFSKAAKVLGNPPSYAVQVYSNFMNLLGQGMNPFKGMSKGVKMGAAQFSDSPIGRMPGLRKMAGEMDLPSMDEFKRAKELGLVPPGIQFADIQAGTRGRLGSKLGKVIEPFGKLYSVPDIAFRISAFENNASFMRKAFPGADDAAVSRTAAEITNDTYQNYDYLNRSLKTLSRKGVPLGQFAAFSMELLRNQYNQGVLIKRMIDGSFADQFGQRLGVAANKDAIRKEGIKRAASLLAVYAGGAAAVTQYNRRDFNEEKERAARETVFPEWDTNRPLLLKQGKDGKIYWTNTSYLVPHMQAAAPFLSAMRGESFADAAKKFTATAGEDLLGEGSFVMNSLSQALNNHSYNTGKQISVSPDGVQKASDISSWFVKDLFEPGVVREIEKARTNPTGVTAARQLGFRANSSTIEDGFRYKAGPVRIALNGLKADASFTTRRLEQGKISEDDFQSEYARLNESFRQNHAVLNHHVANLKVLGKSEDEIIKMLRDNGLGAETALFATSGIIEDLPARKGMSIAERHEEMLALPDGERMEKIVGMAKEDPDVAKQIMQREKEYRRDRALKISERDKAIRSLSVTDGKRAKFIVTEMQNSTDPMGVILRYRKKGLLTPEVERDIMQMTRKP